MNGRNKRKLRGKIYGRSKKQPSSSKIGLPTMLKTYLLPSLGLSRSFSQVLAFVYNRTSGCGGACQRSTCNGARIRKHFSARNVRIQIAVSQFSSVRPPGTKAAISPKWNGLTAPNFERAQLKDKQRGIRRNIEKFFGRLIPLFGVDGHK